MSGSLENLVFIVTGAGKGLGRAYAMYLVQRGAKVVVNNRIHPDTPSSAEATVDAITEAGGQAVADHSDVTDAGAGETLLSTALGTYGRLDGVIANAGVSEGRSFHKQSAAEFCAVIEPNLYGTVNVIQPAFRHFYQHGGGRILLSTSGAGLYGEHGLPAYSTAKAALLGLMYALHLEGAGKSIYVNAIAPYAATQMTQAHLPAALVGQLAPEKVAPAAGWLMSPECRTSGEIIVAGAGRMSRAAIRESESVQINPDGGDGSAAACWEVLETLSLTEGYAGAREHFAAFIQGQRNS